MGQIKTKRLTFQVFFFFIISNRLRALQTLFYEKNKLKGFLQRILQDFMKNMEHQTPGRRNVCPSELAYYILDLRIFGENAQ